MPKSPFICEQANMVKSVELLCDSSGYDHYVEIRLKNGQTITVEFEGTIHIRSHVADGMRSNKWGGQAVNLVDLVDETFEQSMG